MKRSCKLIELDEGLNGLFIELLNELHDSGVPFHRNAVFYIDEKNENDIREKLLKDGNKKRLRRILATIIQGKDRPDLYGIEDVSSKTKGIKAMKFTGGDRGNLRIYCKEYLISKQLRIVMVWTHYKKSQRVSGQLKDKIESIGGYEYEF